MGLYDLTADPLELQNLALKRPGALQPFMDRLLEFEAMAVPELRVAKRPPAEFRVPPVWGEFEAASSSTRN